MSPAHYEYAPCTYLFIRILAVPGWCRQTQPSVHLLHFKLQLLPSESHLCQLCMDALSLSRGQKPQESFTVGLHVGQGCPSFSPALPHTLGGEMKRNKYQNIQGMLKK